MAKRKAQILREDWKEGSDLYEIVAYMPVAESFGFAEELFKVRLRYCSNDIATLLRTEPYPPPSSPQTDTCRPSTDTNQTSSGTAHGVLAFSHWEVLDEDPNFVPQTEEELMVDGYNTNVGTHLARTYVDNVRRRKVRTP